MCKIKKDDFFLYIDALPNFDRVMNFVFEDKQRYYLCGYWIFVISTAIIPLYMAKSTKIETIMVRKFFHLMVVVMFVPALFFQVSK